MDALAGYASDSASESGEERAPAGPAVAARAEGVALAERATSLTKSEQSGGLWSDEEDEEDEEDGGEGAGGGDERRRAGEGEGAQSGAVAAEGGAGAPKAVLPSALALLRSRPRASYLRENPHLTGAGDAGTGVVDYTALSAELERKRAREEEMAATTLDAAKRSRPTASASSTPAVVAVAAVAAPASSTATGSSTTPTGRSLAGLSASAPPLAAKGEKPSGKDRVKQQRLKGQSGLGEDFRVWRSDKEMHLRQQFDG